MSYQNKNLHDAVKAYVPAALNFIAQRAHEQAASSELSEDDYYFTRLNAGKDLARLPEYRLCLEAIIGEPQIAAQLDVMAGTNGRRSRSPSAEQLIRRILDLGIKDGRYDFNEEHFEQEYAAFEEAYYCPDILYEVFAPHRASGRIRLVPTFCSLRSSAQRINQRDESVLSLSLRLQAL